MPTASALSTIRLQSQICPRRFSGYRFRQVQVRQQTHRTFDKRKNRCKALFLTVYGVQNRFAVVVAESGLNNLGLCGVNLERNITHTLNSLENTHHHLFFVNFGMTYIDIKNFRTALNLTESLGENIVNIIFNKRLLEQLLPVGLILSPIILGPLISTTVVELQTVVSTLFV